MKTTLLANLLRSTPKEVIDKVVYFILGRIWPEWMGMPEIGVDEELLVKIISKATGVREAVIDQKLRERGDPGLVIEDIKRGEKTTTRDLTKFMGRGVGSDTLSVERVYDVFSKVALATGEGSRALKINLLVGLFKEASPLEARYIARFVT
ncbi:MAG: DNA ligase, partial [Zestosphaera sp.]